MSSPSNKSYDMSRYVGVYLDEAREQLAIMESHLVQMEKADDSADLLDELFRAAHTLKGSSRAMGFERTADLTHQMEELLDQLRRGETQLCPEIGDIFLAGVDALRELIEAVAQEHHEPQAVPSSYTLAMQGLSPANPGQTVDAKTDLKPLSAEGLHLKITLRADCGMKGIRALILLGALEELGTVLETSPGLAGLEAEEFELSFTLVLVSDLPPDELTQRIAKMPEVESALHLNPTDQVSTPSALPEEAVPSKPVPSTSAASASPVEDRPSSSAQSSTGQSVANQATIRVDVARLDRLLNLSGELTNEQNRVMALYNANPQASRAARAVIEQLGHLIAEVQFEVMQCRLLPVEGVFQRMPRLVRDVAAKVEKLIDFTMQGGETEVDRSILEVISSPLVHLLRNAIDHGVEPPEQRLKAGKPPAGKVGLAARVEAGQIVIELTDDGRGIDPDAVRTAAVAKGILSASAAANLSDGQARDLIFSPGFSTAKSISNISGRGVGMDVVRSNVERVGGRVTVESVIGVGSTFRLYLPLNLAVVHAALVGSAGVTYAVPLGAVVEMAELSGELETNILHHRLGPIPLASLQSVLAGDRPPSKPLLPESHKLTPEHKFAVIVRHGDQLAALAVHTVLGERELVTKPLSTGPNGLLSSVKGFSGAAILSDSTIGLILDVPRVIERLMRQHSEPRKVA